MQRMLTIRRATAMDDGDLGRVHAASWHSAYAGVIPQSYLSTITAERRAALFRRGLAREYAEYYLASYGNAAVGVLILCAPMDTDAPPFSMEVAAIYLLPLYWGQGYGTQLMDFAVNAARKAGCKTLLLWVLAENPRACRFYERYGFVPDGKSKTLERGRPLRQIRYRLEL